MRADIVMASAIALAAGFAAVGIIETARPCIKEPPAVIQQVCLDLGIDDSGYPAARTTEQKLKYTMYRRDL